VSLLSQSGNMALELSQVLAGHGLGFARFASLGNQADLAAADLILSCTTHPGTELIAVYCEDFGDGRAFVAAAAEATRVGKPVLLLTVGGSAGSVRGARSHTGALTSDSAVIDAACRAAGVYRVASPRELANLAGALCGGSLGGGLALGGGSLGGGPFGGGLFGVGRTLGGGPGAVRARRVAVLADGVGTARWPPTCSRRPGWRCRSSRPRWPPSCAVSFPRRPP
jgi:hypothetical protein